MLMADNTWMVTVRTATDSDMDYAKGFIRKLFPKAMVCIADQDVVILAEFGKRIVGFAHVIDEGDRIILQGLGVDDGMRGQGVGTLLLQHIINTVDEDVPVFLKVRTLNPAVDLYARHGFFVKRYSGETMTLVRKPNA
jgi:N-acetylglutamate synthase-like GNAT family acetyltransferase